MIEPIALTQDSEPLLLNGPETPISLDPDSIRTRAYELFLARAGGPGSDVDDWLQAEAELTREQIELAEARETLQFARAATAGC